MKFFSAKEFQGDLGIADLYLGLVLLDEEGLEISIVNDILIDANEGSAKFLQVEIGGTIGATGLLRLIPIDAVTNIADNMLELAMSVEHLSDGPYPLDIHDITESELAAIDQFFHPSEKTLLSDEPISEDSEYFMDTTGIEVPDKLELESDDEE
ncbi:MAG: PRC-barrel domain-containing protein [Nitrospinota bacterium]